MKLAIVPSPEMLDENAAAALLAASKAGTKVLVTGHVEGDSYGRETPSLQALGLLGESRPVALHEWSGVGQAAGEGAKTVGEEVTFENLAQHWLRRSTKPSLGRAHRHACGTSRCRSTSRARRHRSTRSSARR